MTELERLHAENAALRRALLRLTGTCNTAAVMLERRHPALDVVRHLEDGVAAASREMPETAVTP